MPKKRLTFDENGCLYPPEIIEVSIETLKAIFVDAFPNSITRKDLFENYLHYTYRFEDEVFPFFEQWINGSFVTQKENPKDIDLVTFLDYNVFEKRGDKILDKFWAFSLEEQGIDSYLVKTYPPEHFAYKKYLQQKMIWKRRYATSRPDSEDNVIQKGFLKIIFEK